MTCSENRTYCCLELNWGNIGVIKKKSALQVPAEPFFAERPRFRCAALALSRCAPAGPLKSGMASGHYVPSVLFRCPPLTKTSFRRAGHQKSTAAALRCHSLICGETEIRTRDTLLEYTRFPGVPLKPLEHLSKLKSRKNGTTNIGTFFLFAKKDSMLCP